MKTQPTVVSTFASPHEPTLNPKACKRASAFTTHVTAFQVGFRIAHAQKNKINLCFVDRLVQVKTDDDLSYFLSIIRIHPLTQKEFIEEKADETLDNASQFNSLKDAIFYLRSSKNQNATKDNKQIISILRGVAEYLRSGGDQRLTKDNKQNKNKEDLLFVKTLMYCNTAKTREEIFNHIEIYNNSRNFNDYIKPVIALDWLRYTIPEKPTSKNQKYITAPYVIKWIEEDKIKIKRTPVASSNIASVGYDAEKQILEIEFQHGAIYQYLNVPKEVYEGLINAPSIGSYFKHNFKNKFNYQKMSF